MDHIHAHNIHNRHAYFATPLHLHLLCGAISFLFTFLLSRVVGLVLQFVLQQPLGQSGAVPTPSAQSSSPPHITLIDKFVLVFQQEFASSSSSPSDAYLFRFCGVLLYTLYALVIAFALSFSALFHSFSFIFFVWRKWIGLGKGLYGVWKNEGGGIQGVW
ncbi:hypothetical protein POJ06DRAFT_244191 [Lipomyces tetrasporus]|uniref:Uncharacterized protein n=1 Tax=Lipomyces tetrasporus TaxID=54092 RepID=A0AAD7QZG4_9ASCO|nr:uncharacterized protein POJ06DRAFT_244191 [Lipomyces tetrasporus]KAJ8104308.1 hypothetical protein POJ06DRAFT_244191 [Lipomyces tetrasporus]